MKKFLNYIKDKIFKWQLMKKHVYIGRGSRVTNDSLVFGYNKFGQNTRFLSSTIGNASYISNECYFVHSKIGNYCSIGSRVRVIEGQHPSSVFVSTSPLFYNSKTFDCLELPRINEVKFEEHKYSTKDKNYYITIGNDVWIGSDVILMEGSCIGDGAIIGAGSLVNGEIPPFSIAVGVPAKVIKMRFDEEQIEALKRIKWWDWGMETIIANRTYFNNICNFIDIFKDRI